MIDVENSSLEYFETYRQKNKATNYQDDCNDFKLREKIRDDLFFKQRNQCAYCERKIDKSNSHLEHIEPRDKNHKLECEYSNLVLSCETCDSCGKYKDSKAWSNNFIHPVLNNPTEFFRFSSNGEILAIDKDANKTIDFLNLNSRKLVSIRKNIVFYLQYMDNIENIFEQFGQFENLCKDYERRTLK